VLHGRRRGTCHKWAEDVEHVTNVCISDVYMFMGRELDALDEVPAGNILGVLRLVT